METYKIYEEVEMGYSGWNTVGSTVNVTIELYEKLSPEELDIISETVDYFDHTLVTSSEILVDYSHRYVLLKNLSNLESDVAGAIKYFIPQSISSSIKSINIKINSTEATFDYSAIKVPTVLSYSVED